MTIQRMLELLEIEHECMLRGAHDDCDRNCANCELVQDDSELHEMYTDVISLLKEQEPVKPRVDADGTFNCGNCGEPIGFDEHPFTCKVPEIAMKFCCECGKEVKWNGSD